METKLPDDMLPKWFQYSSEFDRVCDLGLTNLEPWGILSGESLIRRFQGLRERYTDRDLVPFARRDDNDDVACWENGKGNVVVVIHDFASPGYESKQEHKNFWSWFRAAVEEMIQFE